MTKDNIFRLVKERFNIVAEKDQVNFVKLKTHGLMEPHHYPRFTLVM